MTRDFITDHEGNEVYAREVLPLDPLPTDTDYVPGCWGCTNVCTRDWACKGAPGCQCGVVGCDHVAVQGGLCVKHERRIA